MKVFFGTLKATDALWRFFSGNLLLLLALAGMVTACYFCRKGGPIKSICFFLRLKVNELVFAYSLTTIARRQVNPVSSSFFD